jgi:mannosyltransferase
MLLISGWIVVRDTNPYHFNTLLVSYALVPLLAVFLVSFELPLFSARYFVFAAVGVPLILGIALDRLAQRYRGWALSVLVLLIGLQGVGLFNVYTQHNKLNDPVHDLNNHLGEMMGYINQHFESNDRVVVYGLYWYLSVAYYNRTGTRPLLYTPRSAAGLSTRPGSTGAGTLFYRDADNTYIDHLDRLITTAQRVWLTYGRDAEGSVPVPDSWTLINLRDFGDTQLRLYTLDANTP